MLYKKIHNVLLLITSMIWFVNGLFCKVLNLVPRHKQIVGSILNLNETTATYVTIAIGLSEIAMSIWILSKIKTRLNAILQISTVAVMNTLEYILVPDLLLWGKYNSLFAMLFILIIYVNEFIINKKTRHASIS